MSTMQLTTASTLTSDTARRWMLPGLTAGSVFLGVELLAGAATTSLWRFPQAIAEVVGVPWAFSIEAGLAIHFGFSLALGALFIAFAQRFNIRRQRSLLAAGLLFMWLESAVSIWLVLHTLFPNTLPLLFAAVPFWASFLGRNAFGLVLAESYRRLWR